MVVDEDDVRVVALDVLAVAEVVVQGTAVVAADDQGTGVPDVVAGDQDAVVLVEVDQGDVALVVVDLVNWTLHYADHGAEEVVDSYNRLDCNILDGTMTVLGKNCDLDDADGVVVVHQYLLLQLMMVVMDHHEMIVVMEEENYDLVLVAEEDSSS